MNRWTQMSIDMANQRNYLDLLYCVYPTIPEDCRDIDQCIWRNVETSFENKDKNQLIKELLRLKLFPIKDSYVAYLRKDHESIDRNPATVDRLSGRLFQIG